MLELCANRRSILQLDEETVLRESKELNIAKVRYMVKQVKKKRKIFNQLIKMIKFRVL